MLTWEEKDHNNAPERDCCRQRMENGRTHKCMIIKMPLLSKIKASSIIPCLNDFPRPINFYTEDQETSCIPLLRIKAIWPEEECQLKRILKIP